MKYILMKMQDDNTILKKINYIKKKAGEKTDTGAIRYAIRSIYDILKSEERGEF